MNSSGGRLSIFATAIALVVISALSTTSVCAKPKSKTSGNNVYIHPAPNARGTQVFLLQDFNVPPVINENSLTDKESGAPISLLLSPSPYAPNTTIWYFMLGAKQTAQLTDYVTHPVHIAVWVPVDSSSTGQNPNTPWFDNSCFSYPATYQAPSTATPAGATFVELNVGPTTNQSGTTKTNFAFDTVDISEVNGINAAWSMELPGGWTNSAYRSAQGNLIAVSQIRNNPGPGTYNNMPAFFGDYGNPGVYPFGCTNCASRYNNPTTPGTPPGIQRSGCLASQHLSPVSYPTFDVGCDNAINYYPNNANTHPPVANPSPPLPAYENPPPGVPSLPVDSYYSNHRLYDIAKNPPIPFVGYGICEIQRGTAPLGGNIDCTLQTYPFGQMQQ